jgi:hypothetical protein
MSDADALIEQIRGSVTTVFPDVTVDAWAEGESRVIYFVPPNEDGASVTVTVGDSVVVEAMFFTEDLAEHGDLEAQATMAIGIILSLGDHGLAKVTAPIRGFPFSETTYGPAAGYWGIDQFALSVLRPRVHVLAPWAVLD